MTVTGPQRMPTGQNSILEKKIDAPLALNDWYSMGRYLNSVAMSF